MKTEELVVFIESVLKRKFPNVYEKQRVNQYSDRKINFACPICGDSDKKVSKKRGNIFLDSSSYKCFNDGCMSYMTLSEFIAKMTREFGLSLPSFLLETEYRPTKYERPDNQLIRFLTSDTSQLIRIPDIANRFSLKRLDQVSKESETFKYIEGRGIHLIPDYGDTFYCDSSDNKVYIFNLDKRSGKIIGFAIRNLDPNAENKYIIKTYSDIKMMFSQHDLSSSLLQDANYLNNYYNILNLDYSKPISMTEGQIDSIFIDNCIATTGVSKATSLLQDLGQKVSIRIVFDRDTAGKTQMTSLIKQGYQIFLWNKAIQTLKKKYFSREEFIEIDKIKDINNLFSFLRLKDQTLTFSQFNSWINGYFSESVFDLFYL